MASTRRLAAILAADVVGYSRLMGADEEGTHERLKTRLRELVDPKIAEYRGRIVKNTGDGFLAEFASVVDAVRSAVEVQRGMAERNAETLADQRVEFRIGVNLGDVIAEEQDIFGDGVNIAARLEALAEPGGICISRVVRDQVRDKLDYTFEDLGEQNVKNIARPVRVYRVFDRAAESQDPAVQAATLITQTFIAPRLSIVVLPFTNLSDDREQQYFADGITEDLTTDLSRIAGMLVISRNTAFTYRNKPIETKRIGRELRVHYVLEGSVRRSANQVRVNAQLIDAESDTHVWAERFSGEISDLFTLQDEITSRIAVSLKLEMVAAEAARPTEHPDALDYILRARAARLKPPSRHRNAEAICLLERALALDPRSVEGLSYLASALVGRVLNTLSDSPTADIKRARGLIEQALALSPHSVLAHHANGQLLRAQWRFEEAIPEYEAVLASDRNSAYAFFALGQCKLYTGHIEESIPLVERAIRLSPRDSQLGIWWQLIGEVHLLESRVDEAIVWLEKARNHTPAHPGPRVALASAYALNGEHERAATELAEAHRLAADDRLSSLAHMKTLSRWQVPRIRALFEATIAAGLRKAGMPEE